MSVVALLSWRSGIPLAEVGERPLARLSLREAADTVILGHAASRMLMVHEFAKLTAKHISLDERPETIGKDFARMTARHNVTTNMYLALFEAVSADCLPGDAGNILSGTDALEMLRRTIEFLNERSADLLFSSLESIGLLHRDPAGFERAYAEVRRTLPSSGGSESTALERAYENCVASFPF